MEDSDGEDESGNPLATVLSGGMLVSASKVIALGFGFLTQVVMARLLTESGYGDVVLALAVVGVGTLIATLGLDDGLMREFPKYEDDTKKARGVARAGVVLGILMGVIVGAGTFLAAPFIAREIFTEPSLTPLVRIAALGIPFMVLKNNSVALARGARDAKPHAIVDQLVQPISRLVLIGGLVLAGFQAVGAVAGQIGAVVLASLIAVFFALRILPSLRGPSVPMYRSILAFSLPLVAVQGMGMLNNQLDIYMLGYFLTSARVGIYNIALQLGNLLTAVIAAVAFLLPPVLTRLHEKGKQKEMLDTYQGLTKWMLLIAIPIFAILFFAPELVISTMFGSNYTEGSTVLRILLIGKLFGILLGLNSSSLIALGDNKTVSYLVFIQVLLNLLINVLFIPRFGIEGAAIALTSAVIIGDILGSLILFKKYGLHPFTGSILIPLTLFGAIATVGIAVTRPLGIPLWTVIFAIGFGYPVILAKFALEPKDEELLILFENRIGHELKPLRTTITRLQ